MHDIEILNEIFKQKPTYKKLLKKSSQNNSVIDHAHLILKYGDSICYCEANWISPIKERYLEFYSANGVVNLNYYNQEINFKNAQGCVEKNF